MILCYFKKRTLKRVFINFKTAATKANQIDQAKRLVKVYLTRWKAAHE